MTSSSKSRRIIIGIDPGTRITGYGIIAVSGNSMTPLDFGCIRPPPKALLSDRYLIIHEAVEALLDEFQADEMAIETQFVHKNVQSALKLGIALGVPLISAKKRGMRVFGYSPTAVKCAITGTGKAGKSHVQGSVARFLSLKQYPEPEDAADALAIAICHAHTMDNVILATRAKEL
ncbi:MAG TPA: crossover junction endodeoxyribonuclease RuvC [Chlamydiales bacterium]|nr:crossover junction endodeoxyribonuclease RuvC [Chlamydiales bacterium]